MNLLAHLCLADHSGTSAAGQLLGDIVKGRLDAPRFDARTDYGIRLHRTIDSVSDSHRAHLELRARFEPPFRRYAGILVDIGFDHALARCWADYSDETLDAFTRRIAHQVVREWPSHAPVPPPAIDGFAGLLSGYAEPVGIERALTAVGRRATRCNPLADALPVLLSQYKGFVTHLPSLMDTLKTRVMACTPHTF